MNKSTRILGSPVSGRDYGRDIKTHLIERDDRRRRAYGAVLFLLYLVDYDVILTHGVDNKRLRVWTPGDVRRVVKFDVHTQRFVFFLV